MKDTPHLLITPHLRAVNMMMSKVGKLEQWRHEIQQKWIDPETGDAVWKCIPVITEDHSEGIES